MIANDVNVLGVKVVGAAPAGLTLNLDGTFTYTAGVPTSFTYCGNGATSGAGLRRRDFEVRQRWATAAGITCSFPRPSFNSNVATTLSIKPPGVLAYCKDSRRISAYDCCVARAGLWRVETLRMDENGGFVATWSQRSGLTLADVYTAECAGSQR